MGPCTMQDAILRPRLGGRFFCTFYVFGPPRWLDQPEACACLLFAMKKGGRHPDVMCCTHVPLVAYQPLLCALQGSCGRIDVHCLSSCRALHMSWFFVEVLRDREGAVSGLLSALAVSTYMPIFVLQEERTPLRKPLMFCAPRRRVLGRRVRP